MVQVNERDVTDFVGWAKEICGRGFKTVRIKIFRGGRFLNVPVTLLDEEKVFNSEVIQERLGITVRTLTQNLAEQLGMSFYGGYLITKVEKQSQADRAGIAPGGVIQRIDGEQLESLVAFAKDILSRRTGDLVQLSLVWEIRRGAFLQRQSGEAKVKIR